MVKRLSALKRRTKVRVNKEVSGGKSLTRSSRA